MTKEEKGQEGEKIARDIIQKVVDCYKGEINIGSIIFSVCDSTRSHPVKANL